MDPHHDRTLTHEEKQLIIQALLALPLTGRLPALRQALDRIDSIIAKLEPPEPVPDHEPG